jgi:hypothetical protein
LCHAFRSRAESSRSQRGKQFGSGWSEK